MPDPIFVEGGVLVPGDALAARAVRSSGPGGQNVNKVSSKIELRVNLQRIQGLDEASRLRLERLVARRLDSSGRLLVTSQRTRDQYRNLQDARHKVHDWISRAIRPPKRRIPTGRSAASKERRLKEKLRQSRIKEGRRPVGADDE
ncbi:MAG: aminoacyl-tRNA hydrolase [Acidobacteria bacterium]|nr:aminoacyl-tRNA hydrolase [Acidobacteriota bacterium]